MKYFYLPFIIALLSAPLHAQEVREVTITQQGDDIIIDYRLIPEVSGEVFLVTVTASHNNYTQPLKEISGDVGEGVKAGKNRIIWNARSELGNYSGDLDVQVAAVSLYQPITLVKPGAGDKFKRKKSNKLKWSGGKPNDKVEISLMQNGKVIRKIGTVSNTGTFNWKIPADLTMAENYSIRMKSTNPYAREVNSAPFTIKKAGLAWYWYALMAGAVGGGVAAISGGGSGGSGETGGSSLPAPPAPPAF